MKKERLGLEEYYKQYFTSDDEWSACMEALKEERLPCLRFAPRDAEQLQRMWHEARLVWKPLSWYEYAVEWPEGVARGTTLPGFEEGMIYAMNASSLLPVVALDVQEGDMVLDACAAPGGKALMIAERLGEKGHLVANDVSSARRGQMRETFEKYGHEDVEVWGRKAETIYQTNPGYFDRILVDAPCSSEEHVLRSPKHLLAWSEARIRQLRQRQVALISGLLLALKPGGRLVYSTCAVTPEENEWVVGRVLKKKKELANIVSYGWSELPVEQGWEGYGEFDVRAVARVLPHHQPGYGPMFVSVWERVRTSLLDQYR